MGKQHGKRPEDTPSAPSADGDEGGLLVSQRGKLAGTKFLFALWMVGSDLRSWSNLRTC